jgi:hypothetical protein
MISRTRHKSEIRHVHRISSHPAAAENQPLPAVSSCARRKKRSPLHRTLLSHFRWAQTQQRSRVSKVQRCDPREASRNNRRRAPPVSDPLVPHFSRSPKPRPRRSASRGAGWARPSKKPAAVAAGTL